MTSTRPATAAAVTRTLTTAGMPRMEEHRSGMVRGWADYTTGVSSKNDVTPGGRRVRAGTYRDGSPRSKWMSDNTPTGWVRVTYYWSQDASAVQYAARVAQQLRRASGILRDKGFHVDEYLDGTQAMRLMVCRKDADGNVIAR